jgi:hypothetical protein
MTYDKTKTINIPVWVFSVVLPLILASVGSYVVVKTSLATQIEKTNNIQK